MGASAKHLTWNDEQRTTNFHDYDIIVNATPLGTKGDSEGRSPLNAGDLHNVKLVYDLVYNPAETQLMREAAKAGVASMSGIEMLIAQGVEQFRIWTGQDAPVDAMRAGVEKKLFFS
jgi:shikimate dehydrogenase